MKAYIYFLYMQTLYFIILAILFHITDNYITGLAIDKKGIRITMITWQTFFVAASFCVFLRYICRKFR